MMRSAVGWIAGKYSLISDFLKEAVVFQERKLA